MPRTAALAVFVLGLSGCSFPAFEARAAQDFVVPAEGLTQLVCTSHNGAIRVNGVAGATAVKIHAELSVRGDTQAKADARLQQLRVDRQVHGGSLEVQGIADDSLGFGASPGFAFTVEAPASLACRLTSHNGQIQASGLLGAVELESHNGAIAVRGAPPRVVATSHNGAIAADLDGDGPVDGNLTSHNGAIDLRLGSGRSAAIEVSTSNGRVQSSRDLANLRTADGQLSGVAGSGQGHLVLTTHNGGVVIR